MLRMNGPLRITVLDKDAYYEQRAVVRTPYGTFVLEGRAGASLDVRAEEWELELQHCVPGVGWRPNVRVLPYPWQTSGGLRSRIVRSKDCDWPQGDPTERNFVLRLSATVAERPGAAQTVAEAVGPAVRGGLRTSSGADHALAGGSVPAVQRGFAPVPVAPAAGVPLSGSAAVGAVQAGVSLSGSAGVGAVQAGVPLSAGVSLSDAVAVGAARLPVGRVLPAVRAVPAELSRPAAPTTGSAVGSATVSATPAASAEGWATGR